MVVTSFVMSPYAQLRRRTGRSAVTRNVLTGVLIVAVLCMQMLGLAHGIAHAGWPPSSVSSAQAALNAALFDYDERDADADAGHEAGADDNASANTRSDAPSLATGTPAKGVSGSVSSHGQHHHSCTEYDAAAGTAGVHIDFFIPPLLPGISVLALWQAFASWDAPFVRHFSSRAPPC